jgi:hypothetical protein
MEQPPEPLCEFSVCNTAETNLALGALGSMESLQTALHETWENHIIAHDGGFEQMKGGLDAIAILLLAHYSVIQDLKREVELLATKTKSAQAFTDLAASAAAAIRAKVGQ